MRTSKARLRQLIREALLLELFEGDARRARVYQRILKNHGIDAEIKSDGPEHFSLSFTI